MGNSIEQSKNDTQIVERDGRNEVRNEMKVLHEIGSCYPGRKITDIT